MRNLVAFFKRFRLFLVFVGLQFFALYFFFRFNNFPKTEFLNSSDEAIAVVNDWKSSITEHFYLQEINNDLHKENTALRQKDTDFFYELERERVQIKDKLYQKQFNLIPAKVINGTTNRRNNYFTIDAGRIHGVYPEMGVLTPQGILGYTINVSDHYALVKTALSDNFNIAAMLLKNKEHGLLKWDGNDTRNIQLKGITKDVEIEKGDTIVTKGSLGYFPAGIPVGTISSVSEDVSSSFMHLNVELFDDYKNVWHVKVMDNYFKREKDELEATIENDQANN